MKAQGALKIIKITEGNQDIIGDIFCKCFKKISVDEIKDIDFMVGRQNIYVSS